MSDTANGALERLIDVAAGETTLTVGEFESILAAMETRRKYSVHSYNMYCTSEDVVVVCDMDTEEFVQIELPMDAAADEEVRVTRDR